MRSQNFKVEILDRVYGSDENSLQQKLNAEALQGWYLQSITPQNNENGETENNILVFRKED